MQMWDPTCDLGMNGKDFPCNLSVLFRTSTYGALDMTVFNRSNDMIWGAYGANAVHMSMLQEVVAAAVGMPVGRYWQVANNFHAYMDTFKKHEDIMNKSPGFTEYELDGLRTYPMVNTPIDTWFTELDMFITEGPAIGFTDPFFKRVVIPIYMACMEWKDKDKLPDRGKRAIIYLDSCVAPDWNKACKEWIERSM